MDKVSSYLSEWAINFVKNRDVLAKKIETISKENSSVSVKYKDGNKSLFVIKPSISDVEDFLENRDKDENLCIITLNNKNNLEIMIKNWKKLVGYKFLSIYFINPFSQLDKNWVLFPHTHHKICDEQALETGLKSMFSMVEQITEEQLKSKLG